MSVTLSAFLQAFDAIAAEKPTYQLGGDGTGGVCDCIGLIIGSIRRAGGTWPGTHGSNYAARYQVTGLAPVTDGLTVGEAVFKAHEPGAAAYALPARYQDHPDRRDYYHVGIVRSVDPLRIVHCTGPGIVTDTKLGKWAYHGWLTAVSDPDEKEDSPMETKRAVVIAPSGGTVNLRATPSTLGRLVARVPVGTAVEVCNVQGDWAQIRDGGRSGYMMAQFLTMDPPADMDILALLERVALLEERVAALEGGVG